MNITHKEYTQILDRLDALERATVKFPSINQPIHRHKAPWPDYDGNPIFDGDTIQYPSGTKGRVVFRNDGTEPREQNQWVVDFGEGSMSRLCLQIGDKGRAVVVSTEWLDVPDFLRTKNTVGKLPLKKIDMSVCIESDIDCEFSDTECFTVGNKGKLTDIHNTTFGAFELEKVMTFKHCRPRMNHIHACLEGYKEMPLPEGFDYMQYFISLEHNREIIKTNCISGRNVPWENIIAFEVTGIADGYEL